MVEHQRNQCRFIYLDNVIFLPTKIELIYEKRMNLAKKLNFRKMVVARVQNISSTREQKRSRSPSLFCICSTDFCLLLYTTENYPNLYLPPVYDCGRISTVYRKILLNAKVKNSYFELIHFNPVSIISNIDIDPRVFVIST